MTNRRELICVVLAAMSILPTASQAVNHAAVKTRTCAANLQAIQQIAAMYQQDHDGDFQPGNNWKK